MCSLKKMVVCACNENEDYLQFWNIQRILWNKKGWLIRLYFIGSEETYNKLNKEQAEVIHINPINGINTAYMAQMYAQYSHILEKDNDTIVISIGMDNILVGNPPYLEDEFLKKINDNEIHHIMLDFNNKINTYGNKKTSEYYISLWFLYKVRTFKELMGVSSNENFNFTKFIIDNYPTNYRIRGSGWGTDQEILNKSIKTWVSANINNKLLIYSVNDVKERWLYRIASSKTPSYDMKDSITHNVINNNYIEYIKTNKNIYWIHPFLGHLFNTNKDIANLKIKTDIINPLIEYFK